MKTKHLIMACILHFAVLFLYGAVTGFGYHETPVSAVFLSVYSITCWYFLWKERKHPVFRLCIAILLVLLMIRVTAVDFFAVLPPGPADICENVTLIASLVIFPLCGWTVWMKWQDCRPVSDGSLYSVSSYQKYLRFDTSGVNRMFFAQKTKNPKIIKQNSRKK